MLYFYCVEHLYFSVLCDPTYRSQVFQHTVDMAYDHKQQIDKQVRIQVKKNVTCILFALIQLK